MGDKPFYVAAVDAAAQAAKTMVDTYPEVRGCSVVIDWNMPSEAAGGLPVGAAAGSGPDGGVTLDNITAMLLQLSRLQQLLVRSAITALAPQPAKQ